MPHSVMEGDNKNLKSFLILLLEKKEIKPAEGKDG